MPDKQDLKTVAMVMVGVIAAGYFMATFNSNTIVDSARAGYGA